MTKLLVLCLLLWGSVAQAQEGVLERWELFQFWNWCEPMDIVVEGLNTNARTIGLTKEDLESAVLRVLRPADMYSEGAVPYLYIAVTLLPPAAHIKIEYNKLLYDRGASNLTGMAATWQEGITVHYGNLGATTNFLATVSMMVDEFLSDYLRVNEPFC